MNDASTPTEHLPACPQCGTTLQAPGADAPRDVALTDRWPHFPFCSKRCRLIDLGHWFDGKYKIAGDPVDPESIPENGEA